MICDAKPVLHHPRIAVAGDAPQPSVPGSVIGDPILVAKFVHVAPAAICCRDPTQKEH